LKGLFELAAYVASRIVWTDWVGLFCMVFTFECIFADRPKLAMVGLLLAAVCAFFPGLKRPKT
jgi:hypothetical protein